MIKKHTVSQDNWLTEVRKAFLFFCITISAVYIGTSSYKDGFIFDGHGFVLCRDFLQFWMAGRLAWQDNIAQYYDIALYMERLREIAGREYWMNQLSYPPHLFLIAAPFGLLHFHTALVLWMGLGIGLCWKITKKLGLNSTLFLLACVTPAALATILGGQASFMLCVLIFGTFIYMDKKPWLAGLCLALLTIKPQLGILFPLMLLISGRYKTFAYASAWTIALASATALMFGADVWRTYITIGFIEQSGVMAFPTQISTSMIPTFYNDLRMIGVRYDLAMLVQLTISLSMACLVISHWRRRRQSISLPASATDWHSIALFISAATACTPYLINYDLLPFCIALIGFAATHALTKYQKLFVIACLSVPILDLTLNFMLIPGSSLLPVFMAIWLARNAHLSQKNIP